MLEAENEFSRNEETELCPFCIGSYGNAVLHLIFSVTDTGKGRMVCFSLTLSLARALPLPQPHRCPESYADGYYMSGLIWALERSCSICVSLLIIIRVRVAETLQRCWPHPLPWADVLAAELQKPFLSFTSSLSFSLHLLFTCFYPNLVSLLDKFGRFCVSGHYIFTVSGLVLLNRLYLPEQQQFLLD